MHINTRIAGIPCIIDVTTDTGCDAAYLDDGHYVAAPDRTEWRVLDRRGYPAAWLERKLTPAIERRIRNEINN